MTVAALAGATGTFAQQQTNGVSKFFPYPWTVDTLTNGLRLVTVPTEHKNLVSFYIVVKVGSRNEVEPGKSGFAHFFEHMMFRGSKNFTPDQRDAIMVRSTVALAHQLDMKVVAEGIEDDATLQILRQLGCDTAQGWLIGKPMPADQLERFAADVAGRKALDLEITDPSAPHTCGSADLPLSEPRPSIGRVPATLAGRGGLAVNLQGS